MKILLAIIITATLSLGCAMLEGEQTTTDSVGGGTTSAPTTLAPAVASWSGTKQLGTSDSDHDNGIATNSSGNVYINGFTLGGLDSNINVGASDIFVVKYDSVGAKQWTQQLGSTSDDDANGIATDSSGSVYVTGSTYGGLDGNTSAGMQDFFVVKYDSGGVKQWTKQLGTSSFDIA